ncbi:hypothetical protein [Onishia taeanensis]|uniref:hypothetical protein n=1 Tax=Onishia taeanensis TaxID=284577 RepID=UPI001C2EF35E|nr:hypothetical protein [Halomonas taeanensis]MDI4638473.1 hypothetical protein [Halomonas sp. BMC7]
MSTATRHNQVMLLQPKLYLGYIYTAFMYNYFGTSYIQATSHKTDVFMLALTFLLLVTTCLSLAALGFAIKAATVEMQFGLVPLSDTSTQIENGRHRLTSKPVTRQ